ncbi:helitron helicase-like domain-containing protein [Artemisia annua]|uniref:Helitron helicase-like domain-containing protein n=1 Tax=Artemisia annua TaxID=35608 RepID=A0A2U1PS42_ARTAN|nr:helitron helicase-like domain-containing protein [Artemisia annua]
MAKGMPAEGFHPLACVRGATYQHAASISNDASAGSNAGYDYANAADHAASSSNVITGASGSSHSNVRLTDALQSSTPALQVSIENDQQVGVTGVPAMLFDNRDRLTSHMPTCVNPLSHLPAQAITVDGLVSTFIVSNMMPQFFGVGLHAEGRAGSSTVPPRSRNNAGFHDDPMVFDFTSAEIIRDRVFAPYLFNAGTTLPELTSPARRRSRARGMRGPSHRRRAQPGDFSIYATARLPLHLSMNPLCIHWMSTGCQCRDLLLPYSDECDKVYQHCNALFWLEEKRTGMPASAAPQYQRCCAGGRVVLRTYAEYPAYIVDLYSDRHFMDNIRAYNQMFAMTSFGATIDNSINTGRGPYVFRVSGQIYHWIGGFCPLGDDTPRFLQMRVLREDIIQGLIEFLNENNALVHLFRTARDKLREVDIPDFQIRLFGVVGANQYELPTADTIGVIVYDGGPESMTDYDVVIERHSGEAEISSSFYLWRTRVSSKLNACKFGRF